MSIIGNVGRDVNFKYTQSGVPVADFSVAVTRKYGTGENRTEKTIWVRITCWRQLAEIANSYVKKGTQIFVVGTVDVSAYIDKNGNAAATLELTADNFQLLGGRGDREGGSGGDYSGGGDYGGGAPSSGNVDDIPF
ncbi:MAG TPA: single-stranded DNA-binding protein [Phototrophicaceae bacterium]|nr:single-stranded DNA-binding protein [Phototrophicaceae bacterium]